MPKDQSLAATLQTAAITWPVFRNFISGQAPTTIEKALGQVLENLKLEADRYHASESKSQHHVASRPLTTKAKDDFFSNSIQVTRLMNLEFLVTKMKAKDSIMTNKNINLIWQVAFLKQKVLELEGESATKTKSEIHLPKKRKFSDYYHFDTPEMSIPRAFEASPTGMTSSIPTYSMSPPILRPQAHPTMRIYAPRMPPPSPAVYHPSQRICCGPPSYAQHSLPRYNTIAQRFTPDFPFPAIRPPQQRYFGSNSLSFEGPQCQTWF